LALSPATVRLPCAEERGSWRCSHASRRSRGKRTTLPRLKTGIEASSRLHRRIVFGSTWTISATWAAFR